MKDHNPDHLPTESIADRSSAWFICADGEKTLRAWGSFYTGKEIIYLDEHVVSEQRNMRKDSTHNFVDEGNTYQVQYHMINQISGKLECRFYKNQVLLKALSMEFKKGFSVKSISFSGKRALFIIIYGLVFGVLYFSNIFPAHIALSLFLVFSAIQLFQLKAGNWEVKDLQT